MSAVGGLCMTEIIGAKWSSVCHRAQQEGLKQAALTSIPTENPAPEKRQTNHRLWTLFPYRLETSKDATSKDAMVPCTSRFGLVTKELAD
eukprot:6299502-Ditylum_brightwellii.AAC.1